MLKNELLKVKWTEGYKLNGKRITRNELCFYGEYLEKLIQIYEEGYFFKLEETDGLKLAVVIDSENRIKEVRREDIIIIDELEDVENNFNELRYLVGKLFLDDKFMDLVDLLKLISKNELILDNLQLICDGVNNGNINGILDLTHELLNATGKEEFKDIAEKYGL